LGTEGRVKPGEVSLTGFAQRAFAGGSAYLANPSGEKVNKFFKKG